MKLSKNFSLEELVGTSQSALAKDNAKDAGHPAIMKNLKLLTTELLQPLRDHFGKPVIISSGYRNPYLNEKIGGSKNSQHIYGGAADFGVRGVEDKEVFNWIKNESGLVYGQLILEPTWIHWSIPRAYMKYQDNLIAEIVNGKMKYRRV